MVENYEPDSQEANGGEDRSNLESGQDERYDDYDDLDESDDGYSVEDKFRQLEEEVAILVAGTQALCYV